MTGAQRGLVAPQNTFLETVMKRVAQQAGTSFLVANAQMLDYPIVFVSNQFSSMMGFKYGVTPHKKGTAETFFCPGKAPSC